MRFTAISLFFFGSNAQQLVYYITTFAGSLIPGTMDGPLAKAMFSSPRSLANGGTGVVYVADTGSNTIRKISGGAVSTIAGMAGSSGYADGSAAQALFNMPSDVIYDAKRGLIVADSGNNVIRQIDMVTGQVKTLAGSLTKSGGFKDGNGAEAMFNNPTTLVMDFRKNIYVVDQGNNAIRVINRLGHVSTVFASKLDSAIGITTDSIKQAAKSVKRDAFTSLLDSYIFESGLTFFDASTAMDATGNLISATSDTIKTGILNPLGLIKSSTVIGDMFKRISTEISSGVFFDKLKAVKLEDFSDQDVVDIKSAASGAMATVAAVGGDIDAQTDAAVDAVMKLVKSQGKSLLIQQKAAQLFAVPSGPSTTMDAQTQALTQAAQKAAIKVAINGGSAKEQSDAATQAVLSQLAGNGKSDTANAATASQIVSALPIAATIAKRQISVENPLILNLASGISKALLQPTMSLASVPVVFAKITEGFASKMASGYNGFTGPLTLVMNNGGFLMADKDNHAIRSIDFKPAASACETKTVTVHHALATPGPGVMCCRAPKTGL